MPSSARRRSVIGDVGASLVGKKRALAVDPGLPIRPPNLGGTGRAVASSLLRSGGAVERGAGAPRPLADELKVPITVCHLPLGTSKWNKIEHRLFSFITMNWRGKPSRSYRTIVQFAVPKGPHSSPDGKMIDLFMDSPLVARFLELEIASTG